MFKRVLVANRGEIALRVIRCLREMNIESVIVYSEADSQSLPVMMATHSICIGPPKAADSYLKQMNILDIAKRMACDAIYPGYGFLSENADFAKLCEDEGIVFIGPSSEVIRNMGDKQTARAMMRQHQVPVVPGSKTLLQNAEEAKGIAEAIGYPVLLKATAGGGGKGMRKAACEEELEQAFETAYSEAAAAFGDGRLYLEKYIENPHHIEFQIVADKHGHVVHLGERDCSIQCHNQKLLEESPSRILSSEMREEMGHAAVRAAKAAGYNNVGTVEFVVDRDGQYYFIEMNTRIQVEHPVTEMLTGIDLVKEQIRAAAGRVLSFEQADIHIHGHAMECRINAQDTGMVHFLHLPQGLGVRVETHLYSGYEITPYYDAMLAKVIVSGNTRLDAIRRMRRCLEELIIEGIHTNAEWMHLLMYHPAFLKGGCNTSFWEQYHQEIDTWLEEENSETE